MDLNMRDYNILLSQQGLVDMKTKVVRPKKGKGSYSRKEKHKKLRYC